MVFLQPLEMRLDRTRDLTRILDRQEMPDDLGVVFGLARQTQREVEFLISASVIT